MLSNGLISRFSACTAQSPARHGLIVAALALLASNALAQTAKPDFATIRKTGLENIDRKNVTAWIDEQNQTLLAATDDKAVQTQGLEYLKALVDNSKDTSATPQFREGVAQLAADAFIKHFKSAPKTRRPLASVYLLMTLEQLAQPTQNMLDAFTLGLTDQVPGGRMLAARGLADIRDKLTDQQWTALLPTLQKAASAESNPIVLERMYRVLMVGNGPRVQSAESAIIEILQARLTRFDQRKGWPVVADAEAIKWLGPKVPGLAAAQQNAATLAIARVMTHAVYAYASKPGDAYIEPLERVIIASESELRTIVTKRAPTAQPPSIATALLEKFPPEINAVLLALNKWIGSTQVEGVLNPQPFGFDRGLKIAPPSASSEPAAADKAPKAG